MARLKPEPAHADLMVYEAERLSKEQMGVELGVRITDAQWKPIGAWPFSISIQIDDTEQRDLIEAETNEEGEYTARTVIEIQEGMERRLLLALEGCSVTATKTISGGEKMKKLDTKRRIRFLRGSLVRDGEKLTLEKGLYDIGKDIVVEKGGILEIEAGAILKFRKNAGIICRGRLNVKGTQTEGVIFEAQGLRWQNIFMEGAWTSGSSINHCRIKNGSGRTYQKKKAGGGLLMVGTCGAEIKLVEVDLELNASEVGGGLACINSSPEILLLRASRNQSESSNGALYFDESPATLSAVTVEDNQSCGIVIQRSTMSLEDAKICGNNNGGIRIEESDLHIVNGCIEGNTTEEDGGGLNVLNSSVGITASRINFNHASKKGGGINSKGSDVVIDGCEMRENESREGGGIFFEGDPDRLKVENCELEQNLPNNFEYER